MLVKLIHVFKLDSVKIAKQVESLFCILPGGISFYIFNNRLWMYLFLYVDWHNGYGKVFAVLFIFAFQYTLGVKGRVTRIKYRLR